MSAHTNPVVWAFVLIALIALGLLWSLGRQAKVGAGTAAPASNALQAGQHESLLLRFVEDPDGTRRGETVALHEGRVVLKTPEGFCVVDTSQLDEGSGGNLRLGADIDWERARADGEAWRQHSHEQSDKGSPEPGPSGDP